MARYSSITITTDAGQGRSVVGIEVGPAEERILRQVPVKRSLEFLNKVPLHEASEDRTVFRGQTRVTCPPASAPLFGEINGNHNPYSASSTAPMMSGKRIGTGKGKIPAYSS
jgi:hypothetical protein